MRKTDKKTDNALIDVLTEVCEIAKEKYDGFVWLTHFVNYRDFPGSLTVVCVFDTNAQLAKVDMDALRFLIKEKLASMDINIKDIGQHVRFDTEENCRNENNGQWQERFR